MRQVTAPLLFALLALGSPMAVHGQQIDVAEHSRLAPEPAPRGAVLVSVGHRTAGTRQAVEDALVHRLDRRGIRAMGERALEPATTDQPSPASRQERIRAALKAGTVESVMMVVLHDGMDVEVSGAGVRPPTKGQTSVVPPASDPAAKRRELDWDRPVPDAQMSQPGVATAEREPLINAQVDLYAGAELRPLWSLRATVSGVGDAAKVASALADTIVAVARTDHALK